MQSEALLYRTSPQNSGSAVSLLPNRLQVAEEIQLICDNPLLVSYNHVWKNAHWFGDTQTILPQSPQGALHQKGLHRGRTSASQLEGIKMMQEALTVYTLESEGDIGGASLALSESRIHKIKAAARVGRTDSRSYSRSESCKNATSIVDICERILHVSRLSSETLESGSEVQAVVETKLLLAFLSANEAWLLKSPRSLRSVLWERGLQFSSLFGHSHDHRGDVNLSSEDLRSLSDPRANFPGCVRWRKLIDFEGIPHNCRTALIRSREILFFKGAHEVQPFLELIIREVTKSTSPTSNPKKEGQLNIEPITRHQLCSFVPLTNPSIAADTKPRPDTLEKSLNERSLGESQHWLDTDVLGLLGHKRFLANFPFRGATLAASKLVWSTALKDGKYSLKLSCPLVPYSIAKFMHGAHTLLAPSALDVQLAFSLATEEVWQSFLPDDVSHHSKIVSQIRAIWGQAGRFLEQILPLAHFHLPAESIDAPVSLQLAMSDLLKRHNLSDPDSGHREVLSSVSVDDMNTQGRISSKNGAIEFLSAETQATVTRTATSEALVLVQADRNLAIEVLSCPQPRKRIATAPTLLKKSLKSRAAGSGPKKSRSIPGSTTKLRIKTLVSRHRIHAIQAGNGEKIWASLKVHQRKSLISFGNLLACCVGEFLFAPSLVSLKVEDLAKQGPNFFKCVDAFVVSSSFLQSDLCNQLPWIDPNKLRSLFWLHELLRTQTRNAKQNQLLCRKAQPSSENLDLDYSDSSLAIVPLSDERQHESLLSLDSPLLHVRRFSRPATLTSRSLFILVSHPIIADLAGPLVHDPHSRILLGSHLRPLKLRLKQLDEKQKRWEKAALAKLSRYNQRTRQRAICCLTQSCPSFKVHVVCILPLYLHRENSYDDPTYQKQPVQQQTSSLNIASHLMEMDMNTKLKELPQYSSLKVYLDSISKIQKEAKYVPPEGVLQQAYDEELGNSQTFNNNNNAESRILVSIVPMDFLESYYQIGSLSPAILTNLRFEWKNGSLCKDATTSWPELNFHHSQKEKRQRSSSVECPRKSFRLNDDRN